MRDMSDELVPVQVVVTVWILPDADPEEVFNEMDYSFDHESIKDYEIREVNPQI